MTKYSKAPHHPQDIPIKKRTPTPLIWFLIIVFWIGYFIFGSALIALIKLNWNLDLFIEEMFFYLVLAIILIIGRILIGKLFEKYQINHNWALGYAAMYVLIGPLASLSEFEKGSKSSIFWEEVVANWWKPISSHYFIGFKISEVIFIAYILIVIIYYTLKKLRSVSKSVD